MATKNRNNIWLMLVATSLTTFMTVLDASIVNIAMPKMSTDLNIPMNRAEWAVSFYLVTICILITLFGKLGDEIGKIRIFQIGTVIFVLGSLICGVSHSLALLLAGRLIQAIGASMTMASNFGIITQIFPNNLRGRALGILNSFVSLGSIAGPGIGGLILQQFTWQDIFLINVPVGIITFILGIATFPLKHHAIKIKIDVPGFSLWALAVLSLFVGIFEGQEVGFTQPKIVGLFILTIGFFMLFYYVEKRSNDPMINFNIFSNHDFTTGLICALLVFVTTFFANVLMPFYLEKTLALNALTAGIVLMGIPIMMLITAPISGAMSDTHGSQGITFIGLIALTVAEIYFAVLAPNQPFWWLIIAILLSGIGIGMFQSPNNALIMSSVDAKYLGIAGSLNGLAREVGMVFGLSISTTVLYLGMSTAANRHITTYVNNRPEWFVTGMHASYLVAVLCAAVALLITGYRLLAQRKLAK